MKLDWSFPKQILLALAVICCVGGYPLVTNGSREVITAAIIGGLLATVNVLVGYAAVEYSFGKSTTTFFTYVIGGMGLRLFVLTIVLVALIKLFGIHAGVLVGSMGIFYIVFLTLEILFIQKKVSSKHQS